jgi:hypothetical protein
MKDLIKAASTHIKEFLKASENFMQNFGKKCQPSSLRKPVKWGTGYGRFQ